MTGEMDLQKGSSPQGAWSISVFSIASKKRFKVNVKTTGPVGPDPTWFQVTLFKQGVALDDLQKPLPTSAILWLHTLQVAENQYSNTFIFVPSSQPGKIIALKLHSHLNMC